VRRVRLSSGCASAAPEVNLKLADAQALVFTAAFEAGSWGVCVPAGWGELWAELKDDGEWLSPVSRATHAGVLGANCPLEATLGAAAGVICYSIVYCTLCAQVILAYAAENYSSTGNEREANMHCQVCNL